MIKINGKQVDVRTIEFVSEDGLPSVIHAEFTDGTELLDEEIDILEYDFADEIAFMADIKDIESLGQYEFDMDYDREPEEERSMELNLKKYLN